MVRRLTFAKIQNIVDQYSLIILISWLHHSFDVSARR